MLIDFDCSNQSIEIDTHNFFFQNQSIFIDFIDRRKTFNFGLNTAFYPWYHISYEIKRLLQQMD